MEMETKTACSGRIKRKVGWRQMGKEGRVGEGISQVAGSPAFQNTQVCASPAPH